MGFVNHPRRSSALLGLLLALCLVRLWLMQLPSSFWLDETGTMFVVRQGAHHPSLAIAQQVCASVYFWLPRTAEALLRLLPASWLVPGVTETAYRIPSVLALGAACFVIARLAQRLIHPQAAWFAVFACLGMQGFNYEAADARPYALGTLVAASSVWALIRWLDSSKSRDALLFIVLASLVWRVHLVYWPFYAVFAVYAAVRVARRYTALGWWRASAVFCLLALALIPVLVGALPLFHEAGAHVIVALPGRRELWRSLKIGLIAQCAVLAWLVSRLRKVPKWGVWEPTGRQPASLSLVLAWWMMQPLALAAFSRLTGNSVFVDRYLSISLPGAALTATATAAVFMNPRYWKPAAAILGCGVLLFMGQWNVKWPPHQTSNWRAAAEAVNKFALDPSVPVICPSGFIEARPPVWTGNYPLPGFLYSPLAAYPVKGRILLLPFDNSPEAERYVDLMKRRTLVSSARFILYGPQGRVEFWNKWIEAQPELAGWHNFSLRNFGDVRVVVFDRP